MKEESEMEKRRTSYIRIFLMIAILAMAVPITAQAQVPMLINYQGMVTNNKGKPLDGSYLFNFYLYSQDTGGTAFWTEQQSVLVIKGIFNVQQPRLTNTI